MKKKLQNRKIYAESPDFLPVLGLFISIKHYNRSSLSKNQHTAKVKEYKAIIVCDTFIIMINVYV